MYSETKLMRTKKTGSDYKSVVTRQAGKVSLYTRSLKTTDFCTSWHSSGIRVNTWGWLTKVNLPRYCWLQLHSKYNFGFHFDFENYAHEYSELVTAIKTDETVTLRLFL